MTNIRFGTDGWRGLIAEDFTFGNIARCAQGLCDHLKEAGTADKGLIFLLYGSVSVVVTLGRDNMYLMGFKAIKEALPLLAKINFSSSG